jgi:hypothetical protein
VDIPLDLDTPRDRDIPHDVDIPLDLDTPRDRDIPHDLDTPRDRDIPHDLDIPEADDHLDTTQTTAESDIFTSRLKTMFQAKKTDGKKKTRRHIGKIIAGKAVTENEIKKKIHQYNEEKGSSCKQTVREDRKNKTKKTRNSVPEAGPSHIYVSDSDMTVSDMDIDDEEKCCVCSKFTPEEVRRSTSVIFVKWAQCDNSSCGHWVHLKFCSQTKVIRKGDTFYCEHCPAEE